jgi:PAS domain S-box-containing protein
LNKRDVLKIQTENVLKNTEQEISAIFESAPDAVIVINHQSLILRWNPEAEKLFGWKVDEVLNREMTDIIIPPDLRFAHREGMRRYLLTGEQRILGKTVDIVALKKDGSLFDVALRISPVSVNNEQLFVGFIRDISDQKKIARKLESFNEELSLQVNQKTKQITEIFERLTDGYLEMDREFRYTYVNKKAAEHSQLDRSQMIGRYVWDVFPQAVGSATYHAFQKAMEERINMVFTDYYEPLDLYQENHVYPTTDGLAIFVRDITTKKRAEKALKENEIKYRTLFDEAADAILVLEPGGKYLEANKKASELLGYSVDEILRLVTGDLIFPEDKVPTPYKELNEGRVVMIERNLRHKTGKAISVETTAKQMPDGNILAFIRDVTERKKAERAILDARQLSDKLIDSLPGVFYFFDGNGKFIRWNKQFEIVTGYTASEIGGMHPTDFFHTDEKEYIGKRIEGVFEKGVNDAEAHFLTKTGEKIPYYFRAVLINYEGQPCLLGNGIDITEQKVAVTQLKLSEQKYKLLFHSNPQPMFMLALPGYNIIEVNTSALGQYGYTKEEFLNLSVYDLRPAEDVEKFKASTDLRFRSIQHAGIWRHRKKDGTIIYVDITTHDVYYEERPVRLVLASDVTEKYVSEEKLKESYDSIRQLTEHLQNIREEERTHIAREIHDELGQQLTVLKMDVAWLNKKIENPSTKVTEKMNELLAMIDTTVKTVRRISSELRPSLLDDLGLVPAMEWHLEEFHKRSGLLQHFTISDKNLQLPDDVKIGLFRIFQESLTNVARHAGAKKVDVSLEKNDKQVILTIRDDGHGFDEADASKKTLGILGMKERTLMLGGQYTIKGIPGEGTIVSVSVPLTGAAHKTKKETI